MASKAGHDEDVFEPHPGDAEKRREGLEEQRIAGGLVAGVAEDDLGRALAEQRVAENLLGRLDGVRELLVLREIFDELQNQRHVAFGRRLDSELHRVSA
jgi:hypothetical protein